MTKLSDIDLKEFILQKKHLHMGTQLDWAYIDEIEKYIDPITQNLLLNLRAFCLIENDEYKFEYEVAAGPIQAFKEKYFPIWLQIWFPVKYEVRSIMKNCDIIHGDVKFNPANKDDYIKCVKFEDDKLWYQS